MEIFIEQEKKTLTKDFEGTGSKLFKELGIESDTVLLVKNNELVTEEEELKNSDSIKILSVVSGG